LETGNRWRIGKDGFDLARGDAGDGVSGLGPSLDHGRNLD
jgi:hypothetical protein